MKRKLFTVMASAAILLGSMGLAACSSTPDEHDHIWNDGEVTTQASCTEEGVKTYMCTVSGCNETKTEPVGKSAHRWNSGTITEEPSCTKTGLKTFTCGVCGETRTDTVGKNDHSYDAGTLTIVPTLTKKGETTYKCGECGDVKKESVDSRDDFTEHFYTSIADATTWQYGYAEGYDAETGEFTFNRITQTAEEQPAVWKADGIAIERNKIYSAGNAVIAYPVGVDMQLSVTVSFTGDEDETRVSASLCVMDTTGNIKGEPTVLGGEESSWNYSTQEEISVVAGDTLYMLFINSGNGTPSGTFSCRLTSPCQHMWDDGEVTSSASCTALGVMTYKCSLCGETREQEIPMTAHDFTGEWKAVQDGHAHKCINCEAVDTNNSVAHNNEEDIEKRVPATCHSDGTKTMVCTDCGAETTKDITERPDHSLSGWEMTDGGHNKHCLNEGCTYVSATENHNMQGGEIIKPPSATEQGQQKTSCSDCGYEDIIYLPTTDHTASESYGKDNDYHWNICGAHLDPACGEKVNIKPHDYKELTDRREDPTCGKDGKSYWECVCGATKEKVISKDSVQHTMNDGEITTQPTFWAEGVKTYTCIVCGHTETEAVARNNSTSVDVNDENWKFGVVDYNFSDNTFNFTQATYNSDGYKIDGTQIKNDWFSGANFDTFICIAYTFKEDVDADIAITFKGIGGEDGILSDYSVRIGIDGIGEWGDRGTDFTVNRAHNFKAGDTVYFIFKHETDGWDQGNYSITINRAASAQN